MEKQQIISKELLKDRYFLANILKAVVSEYKDVSEQDIAFKCIEPESIRDDVEVSRDRESGLIFEAKTHIDNKTPKIQIKINFDIEVQSDHDTGLMGRRAVYNGAKMLDEQVDKVCTIWICINPPEYVANTITRFKVGKKDIFGTTDILEEDYNLIESVIIGLGNEDAAPDTRIYELLYALFGSKPGEEKLKQLRELGYRGTSLEKIASKVLF